jgi:Chaperone of endosialidase
MRLKRFALGSIVLLGSAAAGPVQAADRLMFNSVAPCRILDTRLSGAGALGSGETRTFHVVGSTSNFGGQGGHAGGCGLPGFAGPGQPQVQAVLLNFVAVTPAGAGHLTAWASDTAAPLASVLNYAKVTDQTLGVPLNLANGIAVPVRQDVEGDDISINAAPSSTHVVADVVGYWRTISLPSGAVGTTQIIDSSVTAAKLAPGAAVKSLNAQTDAVTLAGTNGLSVSQGAGTVTVTSNATPNYSTNTIVSRDGSGNLNSNGVNAGYLSATSIYGSLMNVDVYGQNQGTVTTAGLLFGAYGATGEGIASKRNAGGNQFGLDLYTQYAPRLSLTQSGNTVADPQGLNGGDLTTGSLIFGVTNSGEGIASKRTASGNQLGLDFYTNNAPRLSLTHSGNTIMDAGGVNVGDMTTGTLLFGGMLSGEGMASKRTLGGNNPFGLDFYTFYTQRMYITQGGLVYRGDNVATFNQVSDGRLKNVKSDFDRGLKEILALTPVRYEYKPDNPLSLPAGEHVGLVAQDVQALIPEAVTRDEKGYLGVTLDPVFWSMLNAIKEQQAQIEALRREVQRLAGTR